MIIPYHKKEKKSPRYSKEQFRALLLLRRLVPGAADHVEPYIGTGDYDSFDFGPRQSVECRCRNINPDRLEQMITDIIGPKKEQIMNDTKADKMEDVGSITITALKAKF